MIDFINIISLLIILFILCMCYQNVENFGIGVSGPSFKDIPDAETPNIAVVKEDIPTTGLIVKSSYGYEISDGNDTYVLVTLDKLNKSAEVASNIVSILANDSQLTPYHDELNLYHQNIKRNNKIYITCNIVFAIKKSDATNFLVFNSNDNSPLLLKSYANNNIADYLDVYKKDNISPTLQFKNGYYMLAPPDTKPINSVFMNKQVTLQEIILDDDTGSGVYNIIYSDKPDTIKKVNY